MTAVIHDRNGNRLHVPPTLSPLAPSQRRFQSLTAERRAQIAHREIERWEVARNSHPHIPRLAQQLMARDDAHFNELETSQ